MSIRSHPRSELLLSYATGALDEAASVLVATHLALCPQCRAGVGQMEAVGGALLDALPAMDTTEHDLARVMARLDKGVPDARPTEAAHRVAEASQSKSPPSDLDTMLPQPLRGYVQKRQAVRPSWRRLLNFHYIDIKTRGRGWARLLRVSPGDALPHHGHSGEELVLVLAGGYSDATGTYHRGDVAGADASLAHKPVAEHGETCFCLTVNYGWLLPTPILAPLGRLFQKRASL